MNLRELREARLHEPGVAEGYQRARRAFELGQQIRELREAAGLTQRDLAQAAATSQAAVARIEAGGTELRISTLDKIGAVLGARLVVAFTPAE